MAGKGQSPPKIVGTPLVFITNNYFFSFPRILFQIRPLFPFKTMFTKGTSSVYTKHQLNVITLIFVIRNNIVKGEGRGQTAENCKKHAKDPRLLSGYWRSSRFKYLMKGYQMVQCKRMTLQGVFPEFATFWGLSILVDC